MPSEQSYILDQLLAARYALLGVRDSLRTAGVPLGIRDQLVTPLGRWLQDQIEHAEAQEDRRYRDLIEEEDSRS